jgi:hypothetical protein
MDGFDKIRKSNQIPENIVHTSEATQYTLYYNFFLKKIYNLYPGTEELVGNKSIDRLR